MCKYRMVCLDIDGTLLNSKNRLTINTKKIINVVSKELHIPVVLVSARPPRGILFLLEELEIKEPIICYSGALILDRQLKELSSSFIEIECVKGIRDCAKNFNIHMSLYSGDNWYEEELDEWVKQEGDIVRSSPEIVQYDNIFDLWYGEKLSANKILCMGDHKNIENLNRRLKDLYGDRLNIHPSKPTYLEVMPYGISKTNAIKFLSKSMGINRSEIMAVGDNFNDLDMIKYAGLGIAMGNAPESVKEQADAVTLTNDEDGVAEALERYILEV